MKRVQGIVGLLTVLLFGHTVSSKAQAASSASSAEEGLKAHCFCKATLKEHRTTNPADFVALVNVKDLAEAKFTVPDWYKNQTFDRGLSAANAKGSCRWECRRAFGVEDGNVSAQASSLKADLLSRAKAKGQPTNWCGGWLSARLQYAAGTNAYRDATVELVGLGSRICSKVTCSCPLPGSSYDGANCLVATPPPGTEGFIYNGNFYHTPLKINDCPLPGSTFDSNCFVATPPPGTKAFIHEGNLYHTPLNGNQCPLPGSRFDGNCFVATPPEGREPFIYKGNLYYTAPHDCPLPGSTFDGNCFLGAPPPGTRPFKYKGSLYHTPICQ